MKTKNYKYTVSKGSYGVVITQENRMEIMNYLVEPMFSAVYHLFVNSPFVPGKNDSLLGEFDGFKVTIENYEGEAYIVTRVKCPLSDVTDAIVLLQSLDPDDCERIIVLRRRTYMSYERITISIICLMGLLSE